MPWLMNLFTTQNIHSCRAEEHEKEKEEIAAAVAAKVERKQTSKLLQRN